MGAVLFALLTGRGPRRTADGAPQSLPEIINHLSVPIDTSDARIPEALRPLLDRALHPDPAQRYRDGNELTEALTRAGELSNGALNAPHSALRPSHPRPASIPTPTDGSRHSSSALMLLALGVTAGVVISAAVAGQLGAQASGLLSGSAIVTDTIGTGLMLRGPGEPLGAFLAAYAAIEAGRLVSGRTPVDILVTPLTTIVTGGAVGLVLGPPISSAMVALGGLVNWGTERQPLLMGVIVAVIMGMILTLPISSAALGIILDLSGIAAGAATVGCATQMVGFAVASFRENRWSGLLAQGVGTSMLQVPNIVRHPLIWVPPTLASAILGPIATVVFRIESNAVGSGMGTSGLVGQIMTWQVMEPAWGGGRTLASIVGLHFIAPALLTLGISEIMRRKNWIGPGDMALAKA